MVRDVEVPRARRWPLALGLVSGGMLALLATVLVLSVVDPGRSQWVSDQWTVLTEPSAHEIVAIADATGMSADGRLIYLASTPEIDDAEHFREHCAVEGTYVLGCYYGGEIYIFAVDDERLEGMTEVTAAHEMLHAAYARLGFEERSAVDDLVAAAVAALPADHTMFAALEGYDPAQQPGEWHSRLGTEVVDLPDELEAHYARYFDDRTKVLALFERATAVLDELLAEIQALVAEIDGLKADIAARSDAYDAELSRLDADIDTFNARAADGDFASQAEFEQERAALAARSDALAVEGDALDAQILAYNALVDRLTALDASFAELYSNLDSTIAPDPVD